MQYKTTIDGAEYELEVDFPDWKDTARLRGEYEALGCAYRATEIMRRVMDQAAEIAESPKDDERRKWTPERLTAELDLADIPLDQAKDERSTIKAWQEYPGEVGTSYAASLSVDGNPVPDFAKYECHQLPLVTVGLHILRGDPGALVATPEGD